MFTDLYHPQLLFLSEPQIFQSDLQNLTKYFKGEYTTVLNSEDLHNPDLMLTSTRAKGGTMVMWQKELDPYVTVHISDCSSYLPIVIDIPGQRTMIHVAAYMPTAGKEFEYIDDLAKMRVAIEELKTKFPSAAVFVRGDCNSSKTNIIRNSIFSNFYADLDLSRVPLYHNSYHHFMGSGASDSELDVLLYSNDYGVKEELVSIHCKHLDHHVDSHHDLLLSVSSLPSPVTSPEPPDNSTNLVAPKLPNIRHRIFWTESSAQEYESVVSQYLPAVRQRWLNSASETSMDVLIESTNMILTETALLLNKSVQLSSSSPPKSAKIPASIKRSNKQLARVAKQLRTQSENSNFSSTVVETTRAKLKTLKAKHQKLVRSTRMIENNQRDAKTFSILSVDSPKLFQAVRAAKKVANVSVKKLTVKDRVYAGDDVCDGFFDSISHLKTLAHSDLDLSPYFQSASEDYENILKICKEKQQIPRISIQKTHEILLSIRPAVMDYSGITGFHYRYSGNEGLRHLHDLLNALIDDLNNASIDSLNTTWACILHKGHGKDKGSADSYRTISTCPFLSKALDTYIGDIYGHLWEAHQAPTQFQGKGSSHELAALLLTECIQHSLNSLQKPAFVLYLDAMSAFDLVIRQFLVNNLYHYGIQDQGLLLIDRRLKHRKTICEWDKQWMGPVDDKWGLEQGGKNSSEFYKVYNNDQLEVAQSSHFGVDLGGSSPNVISAIGQADDVALVSNDIFALHHLLQLSLHYCQRHHVTLRADKTKLQVFSDKRSEMDAYYAKVISPLVMNDKPIKFVPEAEHVGLLRSTEAGNLQHILQRFANHRKALSAVLPVGLARGHRGNPAASLLVNDIYATPVLFSGLSSLILKSTEVTMIDQYMKQTVQRLQKLMDKTPACVVAFLGGQLPGTALLHMKQLS